MVSFLFLVLFSVGCKNQSESIITFTPNSKKAEHKSESVIQRSVGEDISYEDNNDSISQAIEKVLSNGYNIKNSLPDECVVDGSVDYTSYVQQAVNNHQKVIFPNFPILVNDDGINISSNREVLFLPGSKLILKPSSNSHYRIIEIRKADNVTLYNPVIVGDRYEHKSEEGQWGMGIGIYSSRNVYIHNPNVKFCWGDGIYISRVTGSYPSSNIKIQGGETFRNRRNNVTLISGENVKIYNHKALGADGTLPMAGLDIEPNGPDDLIKNIEVLNLTTQDNKGKGVQVSINKFMKEGYQPTSIRFTNHRDSNSTAAVVVSCGHYPKTRKGVDESGGYIEFIDPVWSNNSEALRAKGFKNRSLFFNILNPKLYSEGKQISREKAKSLLEGAVGYRAYFNLKSS